MQSLVRKGAVDDRVADYGFLIVDECHHVPARSFELVVSRAKARYAAGLTATVVRKDGHHPIVCLHCGPVRHRADRRNRRKDVLLQENGYLVLRFLAEDLGTRLDAVLDDILRALAHRDRRG